MNKAEIQALQKELMEAYLNVKAVNEDLGRLRERLEQANRDIRERDKLNNALTEEVNSLRSQLRQEELTSERMRGYLDAMDDAKPPVMIPEPRERRFGYSEPVSMGYVQSKNWWDK